MVELTKTTIDLARVLASVAHPDCGGSVLFVGSTRRWTELPRAIDQDSLSESALLARETSHLVYEAYEDLALKQLERLESMARHRWPLRRVTLVHRLGQVEVEEASVAVAVSAPHRAEAFEAAEWLIDELKREVPIWKQEHFVQNGAEWIHPTSGSCDCGSQKSHPTSGNQQQQQSQQ